jgi:hypothetical protein
MSQQNVDWQPVIDWLAGVAKAGEEFAAREAPALAEEVVRWGIVSGCVQGGLGVLALVVGISLLFNCWRVNDDVRPWAGVQFIGGGILAFVMVVVGLVNIPIGGWRALKAYTAPRLYLVEQIAEVVR